MARDLGISATAVSLALKESPRVSAAMRARVRRLAQASGYIPNARLSELMYQVRNSVTTTYHATLGALSLYPEEEPWRTRPYLKVLLDSAVARAQRHGYRLEYFWLKRPGMSPARFRNILEARGVRGLFCLGSADPEEPFPAELGQFAVTTFAATIPSRLHRVASHCEADARLLFDELRRRNYRRPGLSILVHGDRRTDYAYSACFLSAQERLFPPSQVPILRSDEWNEAAFARWFAAHRPDVIVLHQSAAYVAGVEGWLQRHRWSVPGAVGLALLDLNPNPRRYAGICQDPARMGATATELLIGRVLLGDCSTPLHPKVELVVGDWNEGRTLRPVRAARRRAA
jgi:DNA-binding LacI/PurR family transcriptional regulator